MAKTRERIIVRDAYELDYELRRQIARDCRGWIRSGGAPEGEAATVRHGDKEYVFQDEGLIDFLYAVKDEQNVGLYALKDLIEYIEKAATQPPSIFLRDAIVQAAAKARKEAGMPDG